ncbi:MAG: glycosyltransferase [Planctomycetota bacterium]|jgi:glycosyltransferase involved in cell wall biosynthesis
MLKAAFILESETSAAARYRVLVNVEEFERRGVDVYPMILPRSARGRRRLYKDAGSCDVVVLQRRLIQPWELRALRGHARVLGYDFDDALTYRDSGARGFFSFSRRVKFRGIVRAVDFLTAGNAYLAGLCPVDENRKFVVPTPVDTVRFAPAEKEGRILRVGWIGSASTVRYLADVIGAVEAAAKEAALELVVVSDTFPSPAPACVRAVKWSEETEADEVAGFDIGIMPLPDNPWTRGKCGFKLLLYGAVGIPSVASPVGANNQIIVAGQTGLFADSPGEWRSALLQLARDAPLRQQMGRAARSRIETAYSSTVIVERWAGILKKAAVGEF